MHNQDATGRSKHWLGALCGGALIVLGSNNSPLSAAELPQFWDYPAVRTHYRPSAPSAADEDPKIFLSVVLALTEDSWKALLAERGEDYRAPKMVLFYGSIVSACGKVAEAAGHYYCPTDERIYLDPRALEKFITSVPGSGDASFAYVVALEVAHHVQKLVGIMDQVEAVRRRMGPVDSNALQVRVELQADCFTGLSANHMEARHVLEQGDLDEMIATASAISDDSAKNSGGETAPRIYGSSEQRVLWFRRGFLQGSIAACNTFDPNL
jgi:predicted metalloprotease